jgi:surfeit locus 1 family protein
MPAGYSFRPRAWTLVLAGLACAAGIALGNWQTRRAEQKRALGAEPASKQVVARGVFLPQHTVLLDNKLRHGRPGYEVITPLRLADSGLHVLVNRGWIAAPPTRDVLPQVRTPQGEVHIEGIALEHLPRALQMENASPGKVRQNLDVKAYGEETGLRLQPIVIEQHSAIDDGLIREWPRPDAGIEKHESYALQWYSLAALAVILAAVFSFRKK